MKSSFESLPEEAPRAEQGGPPRAKAGCPAAQEAAGSEVLGFRGLRRLGVKGFKGFRGLGLRG